MCRIMPGDACVVCARWLRVHICTVFQSKKVRGHTGFDHFALYRSINHHVQPALVPMQTYISTRLGTRLMVRKAK